MGNSCHTCHTCHKKLPCKTSSNHDEEIDRLVDKVKVTVYTPRNGSQPYYKIKQTDNNPNSLLWLVEAGTIVISSTVLPLTVTTGIAIGGALAILFFTTGKFYCYACFWKPKLKEEEMRRVDKEDFDKELIDKKAMQLEYLEWLNESKGYSNPYQQPYNNPPTPGATEGTPGPPAKRKPEDESKKETTSRQCSNTENPQDQQTVQTEQQADCDHSTNSNTSVSGTEPATPNEQRASGADVQQAHKHDTNDSTTASTEDNDWTSSDEDYDSYSEDNFDWEESEEEEEGEYDPTNDYKQLSDLFDEINAMHPSSDDIVYNNFDWQTDLQVCLLSCYGSLHDLSSPEFEALSSKLAVIGSSLNYSELFSLSKILSLVCKDSVPQNQTLQHSTKYSDITDQFLYDLTITASKSSNHCKGCLEACLGEFISHRLKCTSVLKNALLTTVTTSLWSTQDVMSTLESEAIVNDQKTFLSLIQLALINQISFEHIKQLVANYNQSSALALLDSLTMTYVNENEGNRTLDEIITQTHMIGSTTLNQAHTIVINLKTKLAEANFSEYSDSEELVTLIKTKLSKNNSTDQLVVGLKLLCCGVKEHSHGKCFPTDAQLVALCILIRSHHNKPQTNHLLEVLSGEGKSTIIAMFAAFLGLQGHKVDIITSSLELAQRDSADWEAFFKRFGLSSSHNTETEELLTMRQEQADKQRVKIYEEHDIVYGTVSSFSADYLRQEFEMRTVRPKRPYRVAIVDEVDMLMLDEGVQFTYLSHQAPVLRHIEPVLALVWSSVCQNTPFVTSTGDTLFAGIPKLIHNVIFEGINRALCSDSRQLLHVAVQEKIIDQAKLNEVFQTVDTVTQQAGMEIFTVNKMIQLVSSLQDHYLPYKFKVFVLSNTGEMEEEMLPEPTTTPTKQIKRPEFSLLIMDKGFACPLYNQKQLSVAVEKMVSSQCDLPHTSVSSSEFLIAKDDQKYFEGVTGYFHDIIYNAITRQLKLKFETPEQILDLAVKYNIMLESDVTQLLLAKEDQTKKSVMNKLSLSQLCKFIEKVNEDLPFAIQPYELSSEKLVPMIAESSIKEPKIPVLVHEQGLICPLYAFKWILENSKNFKTKDGTCYWVGEPGYFHETIFQCLCSNQILYLAARINLLKETDVKLFIEAKKSASKQKALENCTEGNIQTLLNSLTASGSFSCSLYIMQNQSSLQLYPTSPDNSDSKLLYKEKGKLCQLHLKRTVQIPEFMKEFVSTQLPTYIQSAFTALSMTEEREYLVTELGKIAPIDFQNTGVIERNKRWGGGLQQMLEMKHFLELSPITVITNFISHIRFFTHYEVLYGLSGTIGLKQEQDILRDDAMYKLHSCCIPTNKKRRFYECREVIVQGSREDWKNEIYLKLEEVTGKESRRAALVLCEDINTAKEIEQFLDTEKHVKQLTTYYGPGHRENVNDNTFVPDTTFVPGDIIVATNLAGRGTDIKVSQEVNDCGGLFCLVTFLPRNERVEMQAFGRTARCGNPGSAQLLLLASSLPREYQCLDMKTIRELRAQQETKRLTSMVEHDVKEVMIREELFAKHCQYIRTVRDHFQKDKNVSVIIESINEEWGQWLQTKQTSITQAQSQDLKSIHSKWDSWLQKLIQPNHTFDVPDLPGGNFIHLIKLGNRLAKSGRKDQIHAIKCYRKAIDIEKQYTPNHQSRYTAIAYYNHAYCEINVHGDKDDKSGDEKTQIRLFITNAKDLLHVYVEETIVVLQCVKQTSGKNKDDSNFDKQMEVRLQVLQFAMKKIDESLQELEQLKESDEHSIEAVPSSILQLIPNPDIVTEEELLGLSQLGLEFIFKVKKKPRFCWEGLVVFTLGIAETTVGVCLTIFTAGIGIEIGMGLIAEGVSDCIDGTIGMITGEWSWSQWATMKACSIAVSLATGGVGKFAKLAEEGAEIAEFGARELPKLAEGTEEATKLTIKDVGKAVGKEIVQQGVMRGLGEVENLALEKIVHKIAEHVTEKSGIKKALETDFSGENPLGLVVDQKFASRLPPGYRVEDKMSPVLEKEAIDFFNEVVNSVVASLVSQSEMFGTVMQTLSDAIHGISGKLKGKEASLLHLFELPLVLASMNKAELQLDSLFTHFKGQIEDYCQDSHQRQQVTELKYFLAEHSAFAASQTLAQEVKDSTAHLIMHSRDETQDKALNKVVNDFAEKVSTYLKVSLRKSFSLTSDQELGRVVSVVFVAQHTTKEENDSMTSPSFKEAAMYFESAVHEVIVGQLSMFKDTQDFKDVVHSVLTYIRDTPEATPTEATTDYLLSKLKHMLDFIPSLLYKHCERYVYSVNKPHEHTKELVTHLTDFKTHEKLHSHCQKFFEGRNKIAQLTADGSEEPSNTDDIKDLKCVVALKNTLAEQTIKAFTEAVASILLQNLGWVANQALNRTINGPLAHHISEPRKILQAARENARYIGNVLFSFVSSEMTPYKVEYHGKELFNSTESIGEAELKPAAEVIGHTIELTDKFGHKRTIEPISKDNPTEELPTLRLKEDEEGKYSLVDENGHTGKCELLEALTHGLNRSKSPEHHLEQSKLQQLIALELVSSPNKWTKHYETERMRADLKPHIAKILDPKSFGTVFETNIEERALNIGITIVDNSKDRKVLRKSEHKDGDQITLVYMRDDDHPKGHYDILVDGEHIKVQSEYGNCHYAAVAEAVKRIRNTPADRRLDGTAVRGAVAADIANNPKKWHGHYAVKKKLEQSWLWLRKKHLFRGGARGQKKNGKKRKSGEMLNKAKKRLKRALKGKRYKTDILRSSNCRALLNLERGDQRHADHKVELQQITHEMNKQQRPAFRNSEIKNLKKLANCTENLQPLPADENQYKRILIGRCLRWEHAKDSLKTYQTNKKKFSKAKDLLKKNLEDLRVLEEIVNDPSKGYLPRTKIVVTDMLKTMEKVVEQMK